MDRPLRMLAVVLLSATCLCGGCRFFRPKPLVMDLEGSQVDKVAFTEGAYSGNVIIARWVFQNARGLAHMDQTATRRYVVRARLDSGADGKLVVRDAELVIASFDTGDLLVAKDVKADLSLDEKRELSGTIAGTWRWVGGTHVDGPVTCSRSVAFTARFQRMVFDLVLVDRLAEDLRRQKAWIESGIAARKVNSQ